MCNKKQIKVLRSIFYQSLFGRNITGEEGIKISQSLKKNMKPDASVCIKILLQAGVTQGTPRASGCIFLFFVHLKTSFLLLQTKHNISALADGGFPTFPRAQMNSDKVNFVYLPIS